MRDLYSNDVETAATLAADAPDFEDGPSWEDLADFEERRRNRFPPRTNGGWTQRTDLAKGRL